MLVDVHNTMIKKRNTFFSNLKPICLNYFYRNLQQSHLLTKHSWYFQPLGNKDLYELFTQGV